MNVFCKISILFYLLDINEMKNKIKVSHDENSDKIEEEDEMGYNEDYNPLDR